MSYQVLARKYRPKSFETLVGQEHVVRALTHALDQQRLHHAYLFTGTRGVGKTTLSRILAKSFNCEKGITAHACGECNACVAIDAGRFVDYIEMDAASNRGVDEMASLLEQAIYAPSNARFKVYMIDEVHMLTNHAFNSMLKTLEEPPEHVKFILATTDPQKIPVTVLSRCLQFNLKQMPPGHIVGHLENILGQENISFDVPALRLLAQGAHGSMRDALSLTDQAIAYAAGKVTLDSVQSMLGALDQSYLIRLIDALASEDGHTLLAVADEMAARSLSYKAALQDLGTLLHQIAIAQLVPNALAEDLPERAELQRLSQVFGKEEIQLFYQIAVHGRNEIGLAPDEYAGFTMCLLRMLAFRPASSSPSGGGSSNVGSGTGNAKVIPSRVAPIVPAAASVGVASTYAPAARAELATPIDSSVPIVAPAIPSQLTKVTTAQLPTAAVPPNAIAAIPVEKPKLSPAMAALAAARAASSRNANGGAQKPVATQSATPIAAPASPVLPTPSGSPSTSRVIEGAPKRTGSTTVLTSPPASFSEENEQVPPPWIDSGYDAVFETGRPNGRHKDIQDGDYWRDEGGNETSHSEELQFQNVNVNSHVNSDGSANSSTSNVAVAVQSQNAMQNVLVQPEPVKESEPFAAAALRLFPMVEIDWDGHWPNLAASLPMRGVAQQLAQQSELCNCSVNGNAVIFRLRVPLQTLLSAGSLEKLSAALNEKFVGSGRDIRVEVEIGAVEQTANAQAVAERAERQVQAENAIATDHFVQNLMREFGATILAGSVRPI